MTVDRVERVQGEKCQDWANVLSDNVIVYVVYREIKQIIDLDNNCLLAWSRNENILFS